MVFSLNRTVEYTFSLGIQLIGKVSNRGLLSFVTDIPYDLFEIELKERGLNIQSEF